MKYTIEDHYNFKVYGMHLKRFIEMEVVKLNRWRNIKAKYPALRPFPIPPLTPVQISSLRKELETVTRVIDNFGNMEAI